MANAMDYRAAADWAEHEMRLKAGSSTALRGGDAAKRGREVLAKALGGRPSIDPDAKPVSTRGSGRSGSLPRLMPALTFCSGSPCEGE